MSSSKDLRSFLLVALLDSLDLCYLFYMALKGKRKKMLIKIAYLKI